MMTAGPWRLDALEILAGHHEGQVRRDAAPARGHGACATTRPSPPSSGRKLRLLVGLVEELNPQTWREGPWTILERYVERTGQVLDLLAAGTLEAKRSVANIASFMRFAADWQAANPGRSLADFVGYLDAYKAAGGELPTSVELSEDVDGVRLMTLYQAKGLEFPIVIVPELVEDQWPVRDQAGGWFPRELLREAVPTGDIHIDEERRLLYVAMTRAQERLILTTLGIGDKAPSRFIGELLERGGRGADEDRPAPATRSTRSWRRSSGWGTRTTRSTATGSRPRWPPPAGSCRCRRPASDAWSCACGRASWWA